MMLAAVIALIVTAQPSVSVTQHTQGTTITETVRLNRIVNDPILGFNLNFLFDNDQAQLVSGQYLDARFGVRLPIVGANPSAVGLSARVDFEHGAPFVSTDADIGVFTFALLPGGCEPNFRFFPVAGGSELIAANGVVIPAAFVNPCPGDFNEDGARTVGDVYGFLNRWFSRSCSVQALFDFLASWFGGCP